MRRFSINIAKKMEQRGRKERKKGIDIRVSVIFKKSPCLILKMM